MKNLHKRFFIVINCLLISGIILAQTFIPQTTGPNNGFDPNPNFGCDTLNEAYRLVSGQSGTNYCATAIWNPNTIDLNVGFTANYSVRFDNTFSQGADGISFLLQDEGTTALGGTGGWLGFSGPNPINPSVAVEIDVWENTGNGIADMVDDHVAVSYNGDLTNLIDGPTSVGSIEDGTWRDVTVIWDPCINDFDVWFDGVHVVDINDDLVNNVFGGNATNITWGFTAAKALASADHDICIAPIEIHPPCCQTGLCKVQTDLTACAEEGDFGYIAIYCEATFDWTLPSGSTAIEQTEDDFSILYNASEGTYLLTVTYPDGCTEDFVFTIEEDCCPKPCEAPERIGCFIDINGQTQLVWEDMPGACGYRIEFNPIGICIDCNCRPGGPYSVTTPNNTLLIPAEVGNCFTWRVITICCIEGEDSYESTPSETICFDDRTICPSIAIGTGDGGTRNKPAIYPNPTEGTINFSMEIDNETDLELAIYDYQGRLVEKLPKRFVRAGNFSTIWNINERIDNGIYFLKTYKDNQLNDVQKVIIQR